MSPDVAFRTAMAALDTGQDEAALPVVDAVLGRHPDRAQLWQMKGLLHRAGEDMESAIAAFRRAAALAPRDGRIAHGLAQSLFDAGELAVAAFESAARLSQDPLAALLGLTSARLAEQGSAAAIAPLAAEVARQPGWLQGHWLLSRLRWQSGEQDRFIASLEDALRTEPTNLSFWGQMIFTLVHARLHDRALDVIARGRLAAGNHLVFAANEAICLSETHQLAQADRAFAALPPVTDLPMAIQRVRHDLRAGRPESAAALADAFRAQPDGHLMVPYQSIVWRMLDDPRWAWLEEDARLVGVYDLELDPGFLDTLAARLRTLHTASGEPVEQSLRAGTQTDGPLLSRIGAEFRILRAAFVAAVQRHIAQLPPPDPGHPTLAPGRSAPVRFAGSWSVRLRGSGFHANHVHPNGWLSSAFYIALPPASPGESATAGWLALGEPPEELRTGLPAIRRVEPRPGRLAIFPSTMWHGTEPFTAGERLTVAFDVAQPQA